MCHKSILAISNTQFDQEMALVIQTPHVQHWQYPRSCWQAFVFFHWKCTQVSQKSLSLIIKQTCFKRYHHDLLRHVFAFFKIWVAYVIWVKKLRILALILFISCSNSMIDWKWTSQQFSCIIVPSTSNYHIYNRENWVCHTKWVRNLTVSKEPWDISEVIRDKHRINQNIPGLGPQKKYSSRATSAAEKACLSRMTPNWHIRKWNTGLAYCDQVDSC